MSIEDTYDWAKKQREEWDDLVDRGHPGVSRLNMEISQGGDHRVVGVTFAKSDLPAFTGEVGRVDGDLIFHFWPTANEKYNVLTNIDGTGYWLFGDRFADTLGDAFLEVIKQGDKLCWDFVPEMNSWVVRATGFGDNLMAEELATKIFNSLQARLDQCLPAQP